MARPETIADYIEAAPKEAREKLREMHAILKKAAPDATEAIKWRVPVLELDRILYAFAAYKTHINFMPTPAVMARFKKELARFKTGKGTIHFPLDKPLPKALIAKMAKARVLDLVERDAKWM